MKITDIIFNKWVMIGIIILVIYITGGLDTFLKNPTFLIMGGLILAVLAFSKR